MDDQPDRISPTRQTGLRSPRRGTRHRLPSGGRVARPADSGRSGAPLGSRPGGRKWPSSRGSNTAVPGPPGDGSEGPGTRPRPPKLATECAISPVTTRHTLAQPGTIVVDRGGASAGCDDVPRGSRRGGVEGRPRRAGTCRAIGCEPRELSGQFESGPLDPERSSSRTR